MQQQFSAPGSLAAGLLAVGIARVGYDVEPGVGLNGIWGVAAKGCSTVDRRKRINAGVVRCCIRSET